MALPNIPIGQNFESLISAFEAIGGSTASAIARWVDVPFQMAAGKFEIGVVAFHADGIDKVEFSANGGTFIPVTEPTFSEKFNLPCYRAEIDLDTVAEGKQIEIRAVVTPIQGIPLILQNSEGLTGFTANTGKHSFYVTRRTSNPREIFVANSGSSTNSGLTTASPKQTILQALQTLRGSNAAQIGGDFITITEPGIYTIPNDKGSACSNSTWTTIRISDGLTTGDVSISAIPFGMTSPDGFTGEITTNDRDGRGIIRTKWTRLCFTNMLFDMKNLNTYYLSPGQNLWFDKCILNDSNGPGNHYLDRTYTSRQQHLHKGSFATDSIAANLPYAFCGISLVRGCHTVKIFGDNYANSPCVLACSMQDTLGSLTDNPHSDIFQYFVPLSNAVVYKFHAWNVEHETQNFYWDDLPAAGFFDSAWVDIVIQNNHTLSPSVPKSQFSNEHDNVLFFNITAPNQYWTLRDDWLDPEKQFRVVGNKVIIRNCVLEYISRGGAQPGLPPGVSVEYTHFSNPNSITEMGVDTPGLIEPTSGKVLVSVSDSPTSEMWGIVGDGAAATIASGIEIPKLTSPNPNRGFVSEEGFVTPGYLLLPKVTNISNPQPTSNHPITISLTTTDIKKDISWASKDTSNGITHGADSFYTQTLQIPNYLERIEDVTDPADDPDIGPSRSNEISGNTAAIPNQGGVYISGGTVDITLNTTIGAVNSIDVKNLATKFQTSVRSANGNTFAVILHGKSVPNPFLGEYKYVAPQSMSRDEWEELGRPSNVDPDGVHYENFYKEFAYIAFNSKESPITSSITSNQISFRKSPHHTYINFPRSEMDGLSLSNGATGLSYIDLVTGTSSVATKIAKLQALPTGITCNINSYSGEFTNAGKRNAAGTNPPSITCTNKPRKFVGVVENGNKIVIQGIAASGSNSIFSGVNRYEHNGGVGSVNPNYQLFTLDDPTIPHYALAEPSIDPPGPQETIHFRFLNPVSFGNKNLLAYKVPVGGTRLFGASPNIGITAGSYVRISGSASNSGIYQVLSVADGIEGDTASNIKTNGSTEYQYLELSRGITPVEQAVGNSIKIENVSHLPILHIKYRQPV